MTDSFKGNINRIKPALKTKGAVTGNFGKAKVKGANNANLGFTSIENIHAIVSQDEYLQRLYEAYDKADTDRLRQFCYESIRSILIQRGLWHD